MDDLHGPELPETMAYLYEWFVECSSGRSFGFNGANPLSWTDIRYYDELMGRRLKKWEIRVIKKLDTLWLNNV